MPVSPSTPSRGGVVMAIAGYLAHVPGERVGLPAGYQASTVATETIRTGAAYGTAEALGGRAVLITTTLALPGLAAVTALLGR